MIDPNLIGGRMANRMFQIAYLYAQAKEGKIPDIFVQDYRHFEKYEKEIKELFGKDIGYLPYVGVQLRVGSNPINPTEPRYMDNPYYYRLVESGFFIDAIAHFPNRKFIIFSDDLEFAKKYFEGDKFSFDESATDVEALNKLASCDGHIISNSSFGYWGAFLSPHRGKVVAPSKEHWYSDGVERTICPKDWIRL